MRRFLVRGRTTLKGFLAAELAISGNKAKDLIDTRNVLVNNQRVWIATHELHRGDMVEVAEAQVAPAKARAALTVLYEDPHIIALDKPPGLLSDRSPGSVEELLRRARGTLEIRAIHRLDRDTSGVFLLARDTAVFKRYREIWSRHETIKLYRAVCFGAPKSDRIEVRLPVDGKSALSIVTVLKRSPGYSLVEVEAVTGRTHQIRIHLNAIHHPLVGDKEYGRKEITDPRIKDVTRQMLHCYRITLPGLNTNQSVTITAPIPGDFRGLTLRLGLATRV